MGSGAELPLELLGAFRAMIDELHRRLAEAGHPDARPMHGFALQALSAGATSSELAQRLGVSKQAAGKTAHRLIGLGYLEGHADAYDARRKQLTLTPRGRDLLAASGEILEQIRGEWASALGADRIEALQSDLRQLAGRAARRIDLPGWLGE